MTDEDKTREAWLAEVRALRQQVDRLEAARSVAAQDLESRLTDLIRHVPMGIHIYDLHPDGRLVFAGANPAADHILGIEHAQFIGMTLEEAFPALIETEVPTRYRQAAAEGMAWSTGQVLYEDAHIAGAFQVYAFQTRPNRMAALFVDVTERTRTEYALRENVAQLTALIENLRRGILFEDESRRVVYANQAYCNLFGIPFPSLIIGTDYAAAVEMSKSMFSDPDGFVQGITAHLATHQAVRDEVLTLADGRVWARDYVPITMDGERHGNLWLYRDVTGRMRAQEAAQLNAERMEALLHLNQMRDASLQEITDFALEAAVRLTRSEVGYLAFVSEDETTLKMHAWSKQAMAECAIANKPLIYPLETTGLWGEAIRQRRPIITNNYTAPNPWKKGYPAGHIALRSHLNVPVFAGDHIVIVAGVANKSGDYDDTDVRQLTLLMEGVWQLIERQRTEAALRVSLEKYRVLFESFPLGITITDHYGHILEGNRASERLLGLSLQQQSERTVDDPEWRMIRLDGTSMPADEFASVRALRENRLVENVEMGLVKNDGTTTWISVTAAPIPLEGYGVAVAYGDITARLQSESDLRRERDLSRALAEAAAVFSRSLNPDEVLDRLLEQVSRVVPGDAANVMLMDARQQASIARSYGYERLGSAAYAANAVFDVQQMVNLRQMAATGEPLVIPDTECYPGWIHIPDVAWLRSYVGAPIVVRGEVVGFLNIDSATPGFFTPDHAATLHLFTYHAAIALENAHLYQQVQQELRAREQIEAALRESEAYFHALFDQASDAIFIEDIQQDTIIDANRRACDMLGYTHEELRQLTVADLQAPEQRGMVGQVTKNELARYRGAPFEGIDIRKDGIRVPVEVTTSPLQVDERDLAISIVRDITERKEMEERLRRQERLAAIGQLAAGIAHDFRNLLTTIILYAQLGMRKPGIPAALISNLETIVGEARKATELVQQILDFSSRSLIERQPLDLSVFIGEVFTILRRTIPENIHIALEVGAGKFIVEADPGRIQQVLTNLALNARDAMPAGGTLRIGLESLCLRPGMPPPLPEMARAIEERVAHPTWICLSVADTGIGMTDAVRMHLFEPFFTTKEGGRGTGLGLAQVYGIVRQHEGYIGVETAVGEGTTFRIYLPATPVEGEAVREETVTAPLGRGETILLVEDDAHLREAGRSILTELGYHVLTAGNGREALTVFRAAPEIALVITDLVMPEMGGEALLHELKRLPTACKVLAITGYTMQVGVRELKTSGFFDVVHKPFDTDTLAHVVQRALSEV
ncbi:MAG TPA: GAF domain-containing protein [Anaerolineae bacterium]|nr:GAF domain-containing protein [Anaerolineae bacterium]HQH37154.1 GAF domain-containing protein [Anaerolineae bacterium]